MMNSSQSRPKFSKIEIKTNRYITMGIGIQILVCLTSALYASIWEIVVGNEKYKYLELDRNYIVDTFNTPDGPQIKEGMTPLYITIPQNFGKWFLAMMNFVAISLLVSLEMVKFA